MRKYSLIVFLLVFFPITAGLAYYDLGQPAGFVNDYAGLMTGENRLALETKLVDFEKETGNEIAVVTINSLQGDTIENFTVALFAKWGIGKKDKDNGILVLIAKDDRKMRIEVGYGLEGALTDAQSYWIIQNVMRPAFQAGDYDSGITEAVEKIIAATKGEYVPSEDKSGDSSGNSSISDVIELLVFIIFVIFSWLGSILGRSKSWWAGGIIGAVIGFILFLIFSWLVGLVSILVLAPLGLLFDYAVSKNYRERKSAGRKPSWWAGGGCGSGFGSGGGFGGGSSGGGGASGGW